MARIKRKRGWMGELASRLETVPDNDLGAMFKEYLRESIHNSWDGFDPVSRVGVAHLVEDFGLFVEHYPPQQPHHDYRVLLNGRYVVMSGNFTARKQPYGSEIDAYSLILSKQSEMK